jgi:hypothetical protein
MPFFLIVSASAAADATVFQLHGEDEEEDDAEDDEEEHDEE